MDTSEFYGKEKISRILLKIAPPVMLAQLIQALYNIVDSLFVGKYSETGLTASGSTATWHIISESARRKKQKKWQA